MASVSVRPRPPCAGLLGNSGACSNLPQLSDHNTAVLSILDSRYNPKLVFKRCSGVRKVYVARVRQDCADQ